jgi:hypothetical protein
MQFRDLVEDSANVTDYTMDGTSRLSGLRIASIEINSTPDSPT